MALRGGNALNKGTARKSAKFVKAPSKVSKMKTATGGLKAAPKKASDKMPKQDSNPTKAGAKKAASKMKGGRGRYVGKR